MKAKKLLSILLTATLLLSVVFVPTTISAETARMSAQHAEIDFSSYTVVDNPESSDANNVFMHSNGPRYSIEEESNGNDYLFVTANKSQNLGWKPYRTIIMNPTGYAGYSSPEGYYYVGANKKYRVAFKYKLKITDTNGLGYPAVDIVAVSLCNRNVKDGYNTLNGQWALGNVRLAETNEWTTTYIDFSLDTINYYTSVFGFYLNNPNGAVGYELAIDDVQIDALNSVTLNNTDGTTTELWGAPKAYAVQGNTAYTDYKGESIPFPNNDTTNWYYDEALTQPVDVANAVFTDEVGVNFYAHNLYGTSFEPKHMEVNFDKYNLVVGTNTYQLKNASTNQYDNQPCTIETDGVTGNKYMRVNKIEGTKTIYAFETGFMLNPTGEASQSAVYQLVQGATYRITFKHKGTAGARALVYCAGHDSYKTQWSNLQEVSSQVVIPAADDWTTLTFDFTVPEHSGCYAKSLQLAIFSNNNWSPETTYDVCIDDIVVDRLGSVTIHNLDGSENVVWGAPACLTENKVCSTYEGEAFDLPMSKEDYSSTDSTATVTNYEYYLDAGCSVSAPDIFPASIGTKIYVKTISFADTNYQMAFTGFEESVYSSRKPALYHNITDGSKWFNLPDSLFRTNAGLSFSDEEVYTGSTSLKYTGTLSAYNYRAVYIGNGFEFTPNRTYLVSFYVKAGENNTAKTIVFGVRGGIGNDQWSVNNNTETKTVDLTKSGWQKVTILYTPNEVTSMHSSVTSPKAYYLPQLFVDYVSNVGTYTEGAELYIDMVSIDVIVGDANGDGLIDARDLVRAKKMAVSTEGYAAEDIKAANFDTTTAGIQATDLTMFRTLLLEGKNTDNSPVIETLTDRNGRVVDLSNYGYVWGDEFDGTSLDYLKWGTSATFSGYSDVKESDDNIVVSDGVLTMGTTYDNGVYTISNDIQTEGTMNFKYGYIEYRAKVPFVDGSWAALWARSNVWMNPETFTNSLNPSEDKVWYNADYNVEMDFLELKDGSEGLTTNLHNFVNSNDYQIKNQEIYSITPDFDVNAWHTYGYLWTESTLIMFIDGKEFGRYNLNNIFLLNNWDMKGFDDWMTLHLSNKIYSPGYCAANSWAKDYEVKDSSENFDLQIDYVRVYQARNFEKMIHTKK